MLGAEDIDQQTCFSFHSCGGNQATEEVVSKVLEHGSGVQKRGAGEGMEEGQPD